MHLQRRWGSRARVTFTWLSLTANLSLTGCQSRLTEEPATGPSPAARQPDQPFTGAEEGNAQAAAEYDAMLTTYPYPFDVRHFDTEVQGHKQRMAYMDVGPSEKSRHAIVLLHGKNFSGAHWGRTANGLAARGYRVVIPDQIGFGKSSKPTDIQYSFHMLAHETKRLLDSVGVAEATVVGHSMGGMLATRFALMYPSFTKQLVLVNPIGLEDYAAKVPYTPVEQQAKATLEATPRSIRQYMTESYFDGQWKDEYEEVVALQAGWATGPDKQHLAWVSALTADMIFTQPVVHEFSRLKVPTLLVIGQRDRTALGKNLVPPEVAQGMGLYPELGHRAAQAIPGAQLVPLDAVGHLPHYEAFDAWMAALTKFLPQAAKP